MFTSLFHLHLFSLLLTKTQLFFNCFSQVIAQVIARVITADSGISHSNDPPGYLMLPNLTNQVIKLSKCRPLARIYSDFFVKLGASGKYKLDSSLIFSSRTKSVSFIHENFHLSFKDKIMKNKNRLKIIIITQPCDWVDWLHTRFVDQNFCSVSIMMHDGIFAQFATFIQSITSFNSVIINESSYCASRRRYAQTYFMRWCGGGRRCPSPQLINRRSQHENRFNYSFYDTHTTTTYIGKGAHLASAASAFAPPLFLPCPRKTCLGVFWGSGCPIYPNAKPHPVLTYHFLVPMGALLYT